MANQTKGANGIWYILIYFFSIVGGIVAFLLSNGDKRIKFHALQAILLWVVAAVISVVFSFMLYFGAVSGLATLLIWLYGLYIGYNAGNGKDIEAPVIGDLAKQYAK